MLPLLKTCVKSSWELPSESAAYCFAVLRATSSSSWGDVMVWLFSYVGIFQKSVLTAFNEVLKPWPPTEEHDN